MILDVYTNTQNNGYSAIGYEHDMENLEVNKILRANNTDFIKPDQENDTTDFFLMGECHILIIFLNLVYIKFW